MHIDGMIDPCRDASLTSSPYINRPANRHKKLTVSSDRLNMVAEDFAIMIGRTMKKRSVSRQYPPKYTMAPDVKHSSSWANSALRKIILVAQPTLTTSCRALEGMIWTSGRS